MQSIKITIDLTLSLNAELTPGSLWEMVKINVAEESIKFSKQKAKEKIKQLSFYWTKSKKEKIDSCTHLTIVHSHFWKNK